MPHMTHATLSRYMSPWPDSTKKAWTMPGRRICGTPWTIPLWRRVVAKYTFTTRYTTTMHATCTRHSHPRRVKLPNWTTPLVHVAWIPKREYVHVGCSEMDTVWGVVTWMIVSTTQTKAVLMWAWRVTSGSENGSKKSCRTTVSHVASPAMTIVLNRVGGSATRDENPS
ncbi:hypothetical protein H257_08639 [Aphanomyces astaci]|uniref:Uncharacterized protein n=1 Tax=Aphanomyces astaci TaxID=112090 RepID=W4GDN0_APHAT|nr:hypothetical protein H257_08639 [Aphanomyces astaci]ETV77802.1 hypothetical protein H257_08639 [Aphanomyces astaci]|eukprot:XP_009832912.1 hypothetical protein H257_08639 [Aphanomyces astaci]